jgi:hypothetical protein
VDTLVSKRLFPEWPRGTSAYTVSRESEMPQTVCGLMVRRYTTPINVKFSALLVTGSRSRIHEARAAATFTR